MDPEKPRTLLVIPLYNHAALLRRVVEAALATGLPVLVADDGSTDAGLDMVQDLGCLCQRLAPNQGKGAAILAAARLARDAGYEAIITVDADGQLDPGEARLLLAEAKRQWPALVIGARDMEQAGVPQSSRFGRAFSNFWVRLECGRDLADTQSGLRLYPVRELLALPVRTRRYDFEVEVLVRAAWAGLPIATVPVSVHYPPAAQRQSHFHMIKDNLRLTALHTLLMLRALIPWPHKRLVPRAARVFDVSVFHPLRLLRRLCQEHNTALQLAAAAWTGIFLGALPLLAVHTVVIIYVTRRLHLNTLAAVAASQFCCPPIMPVLCIETGYFLRTGSLLLDFSWQTLVRQVPERLWEWLLGSLLLGPVFGVLAGAATYFGIRRLRRLTGFEKMRMTAG